MSLAPADFRHDLLQAIAIAQLSPSSHNCQPWALAHLTGAAARQRIDGYLGKSEPVLLLALDQARKLAALPAHEPEMLLSCGMYWHLLLRALTALGWQPRQHSTPAPSIPGLPPDLRALTLASFERGEPDPDQFSVLTGLARTRRTNRGPYAPDPADDALAALSTAIGGPLHYWTDAQSRRFVARLMADQGVRDFGHRQAWQETYSYLSVDNVTARRRGDGFSIHQLVGGQPPVPPRLAHAMLHPRTMRMLEHFGFHSYLARRVAASIFASPALLAISWPGDNPDDEGWLNCGAVVMQSWLAATAQRVALHPISVLVQHEDLRRQVQHALQIPGRLAFLARVGYPMRQVGTSIRRPGAHALCEL